MEEKCSFVEEIGGTTYVVSMKQADDAKLSYEELARSLIAKEAASLVPDFSENNSDEIHENIG